MSEAVAGQTRGFLFADLRGYTQFAESHGDQAAAELLARYRLLVREVIARFDGAEIRTEGDSFFVVFPSASAAVQGGLAILDAAATAATAPVVGETAPGAIHVGIGVHAGESAATDEGFVGSAVNLAARICALAGAGELLVSDTVRGLTRTFLPVQFVPRGRRRLKGIDEPVLVYRVVPITAGGAVPSRAGARTRLRPSLALAATVIALPVALLAAAAVLGMLPLSRPNGLPGTSPNVSASGPGATSGESPLTADEQRLLQKLPEALNDDCASGSAEGGSAGGSVSLHCRLPLSAAAEEVWIDEFPTPETLAGAFADTVARTRAPQGDCRTMPLASGTWEVPNVHTGKLLCYPEAGAAWLLWTYDDDRILVRARRGGGDWEALYDWWRETAIFLR